MTSLLQQIAHFFACCILSGLIVSFNPRCDYSNERLCMTAAGCNWCEDEEAVGHCTIWKMSCEGSPLETSYIFLIGCKIALFLYFMYLFLHFYREDARIQIAMVLLMMLVLTY